jgi:hypothetical protein
MQNTIGMGQTGLAAVEGYINIQCIIIGKTSIKFSDDLACSSFLIPFSLFLSISFSAG